MASFTITKANRWPPLPTIQELIDKEIKKANYIGAGKMLTGFDHVVHGVKYHFSYRTDDQANFATHTAAANISQTLGNMSEEQLKATYGTTVDGSLDKSKLPQALPNEWRIKWQGHTEDGPVSLTLNLVEWLDLSAAACAHNTDCINECRLMKAKLSEATNEEQLQNIVRELELDKRLADARTILYTAGIEVAHV